MSKFSEFRPQRALFIVLVPSVMGAGLMIHFGLVEPWQRLVLFLCALCFVGVCSIFLAQFSKLDRERRIGEGMHQIIISVLNSLDGRKVTETEAFVFERIVPVMRLTPHLFAGSFEGVGDFVLYRLNCHVKQLYKKEWSELCAKDNYEYPEMIHRAVNALQQLLDLEKAICFGRGDLSMHSYIADAEQEVFGTA